MSAFTEFVVEQAALAWLVGDDLKISPSELWVNDAERCAETAI